MQKFVKACVLSISLCALSGCVVFHGYQAPFTQGNIITYKKLQHVRKGMTRLEVETILGSPVLTNTFRDNQVDYVYQYIVHSRVAQHKRVVIHFRNGLVTSIQQDLDTPGIKPDASLGPKPTSHHWWDF